jgi:hypothetical protein
MTEAHRLKIQTGNILNVLVQHVNGERNMSATQVSAGIALLRKVLPDLASVQHSGDETKPVNHKVVVEFIRSAHQAIEKRDE